MTSGRALYSPARPALSIHIDALRPGSLNHLTVNDPLEPTFRCPGQSQPISLAIHLARLSDGYEACRDCEHRRETGSLPPRRITAPSHASLPALTDEALTGVYLNQLGPTEASQFAMALGMWLRTRAAKTTSAPTVVIGSDGRPLAAEILAAVCEGMRFTGARVIDVGGVTAACLAFAIDHLKADGGLLVGNAAGDPHTIGLKVWGSDARPLSRDEGLSDIVQIASGPIDRPVRRFGSLRRFHADVPYLACLHKYFHALRPLRLVLDTSCRPLMRYLDTLREQVACEVIAARQPDTHVVAFKAVASEARAEIARRFFGPPQKPTSGDRLPQIARPTISEIVAHGVERSGAHFGMWIDGDGEACRVFDERGVEVPHNRLLSLLAESLLREHPHRSVVIEDASCESRITQLGGVPVHSGGTRSEIDQAMRTSDALLAGGPSGRFCYTEHIPSADALKTLTLLLGILSQSDRRLSEVVDLGFMISD